VNEREREEAADLFQDEMDRRAEEHTLLHEARKTIRSTNIQPDLVARLLATSEPCLFANRSPVAVKPYELPPIMVVAYALMYDVARWHASLQVSFDRSLEQDAPTEGALV